MKNYLRNDIYVMNDAEDMIYKVEAVRTYNNGSLTCDIMLKLICGIEYPNEEKYPDAHTCRWCSAEYFDINTEYDFISFNIFYESLKERLEDDGYTIVEKPNMIYEW